MPDSDIRSTAADYFPERRTLTSLREAAAHCKACDLWEIGTQTVFGKGLKRSRLMLIGEQPGNEEDLQGEPFVGPAGRILDEGLERAGINRRDVYLTNVVKHFKWVPEGKRRLHKKPDRVEIAACLPWLEAEIEVVRPEVLICLGSTAARTLIRKNFRVTREHGTLVESELAKYVMATYHPSAILRSRSSEQRREAMDTFVEDLSRITPFLNGKTTPS